MRHDARLMLDHAGFRYDRIGRKAVLKDPNAPRFTPDGAEGYSISSLTLNEDRPNISALVKKNGTVNLDVQGRPRGVPSSLPSFIYRNYTIVKDAIIHVDLLPVKMSLDAFKEFQKEPLYPKLSIHGVSIDEEVAITFRLQKLGLTTHADTRSVSAFHLLSVEYELCKARAAQKVFKHFGGAAPKNQQIGAAYEAIYGKEGAEWLRDKGITEFGGYAPPRDLAESTDVYRGIELRCGLKGLSSLPKVEEVIQRLEQGKKLTTAMEMMRPYVEDSIGKPASWARKMAEASTALVRDYLFNLSRIKYAVVVGQTWFDDASEPGKVGMTCTFEGKAYEGYAELRDVDIEV
jgi:hypothetical protein